ncbi:hypothetical protein JOF53_006449 [Crossiella equi]|uniref:ATPase AAA-type core domain-containing protein n=1 Tax=Crossiella equi TaxID=130796 RepID=A0ABS5ALY1_9PSEU|nr:AAA family ATPase [Crossiella equi]MBP2477577.1 hypothetical protein [Crossiella equi]
MMHAVVLAGPSSTTVTIKATFIPRDTITGINRCAVEIAAEHGGFPRVSFVVFTQDNGSTTPCWDCDTFPCQHHWSLLEAGLLLPGPLGRLADAVHRPGTQFKTISADYYAVLPGTAYRFQPVEETWSQITSVLPIQEVELTRTNARFPDELLPHVPSVEDSRDAFSNPKAYHQIARLSQLHLDRQVFLLAGPPGTGKSACLRQIAADRCVPHLEISSPEQAELFRTGLRDGQTVLEHSLLVTAIQHPCVVEFVDLHRWEGRLDVLDALEGLLNPTSARLRAFLPIAGGAINVPVHPEALIALTTNRPTVDWGEKWLDRWSIISFGQPTNAELLDDLRGTGFRALQRLTEQDRLPENNVHAAGAEMLDFAGLLASTIDRLNLDPLLANRYCWGTRTGRDAMVRFVLGQPPAEIAIAVFAGKLLRYPALALHALALAHTVHGWGTPLIDALPFRSSLTSEQITAAFAAHQGSR